MLCFDCYPDSEGRYFVFIQNYPVYTISMIDSARPLHVEGENTQNVNQTTTQSSRDVRKYL